MNKICIENVDWEGGEGPVKGELVKVIESKHLDYPEAQGVYYRLDKYVGWYQGIYFRDPIQAVDLSAIFAEMEEEPELVEIEEYETTEIER